MEITWLTAFVDVPADGFEVGADFWRAVTGSRVSELRGEHSEFATLYPPNGDPYLRVQRVGNPDARIHLDLHVDSKQEARRRAEDVGATLVADRGWLIMRSPGGFVFCLVDDEGERIVTTPQPDPVHRLDQLSIDIPAHLFDVESRFWAHLTGWRLEPSALFEFTRLGAPARLPYRVLLQRLGEDDDGASVRAHLDIACGDNIDEVAAQHEKLGATTLDRRRYWTTMSDPVGLPYCLTPRDPETGAVPQAG